MEMTDMENISKNIASGTATSTLALYRELFNQIDLHDLTPSQLLDLAALSAEQTEGLCNGLMLFNELLQTNPQSNTFDWEQLNGRKTGNLKKVGGTKTGTLSARLRVMGCWI
jgi:hypothetical protein